MKLLDRLSEQAKKTTFRSFSEQFAGIYLLVRIPDSHALGFTTRVGAPSCTDLIKAARSGGRAKNKGSFLLRVEKSDRNTWKKRISVGRAKNNDLVLRHDSVSKLHAHFFVQATVKDGVVHEELFLCDVGSANGTLINGRIVEEGEDRAVTASAGDRLLFGEVECELLDASALYAKLRRQAAYSDF
jgi:hypothetical protein